MISFKELPRFTYQEALHRLPQQLAMQDRFGIWIAFKNPGIISHLNGQVQAPDPVFILAQSVNMPQTTIVSKQMRWDEGPMFSRPQGIDFGGEGIAIDFILDSEMVVKEFFEMWARVAFNQDDATVQFPSLYLHDVYIYNTDSQDNPRHIVKLEDAFPRNISMVSFNQGAHNTPASLTVTFTFHRMRTGHGDNYDNILRQGWTPTGVQEMEAQQSNGELTLGGMRKIEDGEFPGRQINNEFYQGGWDPEDPRIKSADRSLLGKALSFFTSLNPTVFNVATKIPSISTL